MAPYKKSDRRDMLICSNGAAIHEEARDCVQFSADSAS
jgi:hypothetical protein